MAELFNKSGEFNDLGVPAPFLQGSYHIGIEMQEGLLDGFGEIMPLGGGATTNRFTPYGLSAEGPDPNANIMNALLSDVSGIGQQSITYNFEGLLGSIGPPGPPGPASIAVTGDSGGNLITDFGKPVISSSIVWTDNDPSGGYIAWTAGTVTLGTVVYAIAAGNSDKEFIYWDSTSPSTFQGSDTRTDAVGGLKWFIARNSSGTALPIYEGSKLFDGKVLRDATIEADAIASAAITAAKTSLAAIDNSTGAIAATHIVVGMIANNAVEAAKIKDDAVTTAKILNDAIVAAKINVNALDGTSGDISANHIVTAMIQSNQITSDLILADNVVAAKIDVIGLDGTTGQINVSDTTQANVLTAGINANATTKISAGKVLISGGVDLSNWSHGSDATMIDGGDVYAHSIIASKITSLAHMLVGGTWTDNSPTGTAVAWAGWSVEYNGTTYAITDSDTTNKYIWWDLTSPTVFQKAATKPTLDTDDDFLACINEAGTHTQAWNATYIHGGTIQALSVNTEEIAADAVTATKINVVGLDGAAGTIIVANDAAGANALTSAINTNATTLIQPGKVLISGGVDLSNWSHGSDATMIDGGDVYAHSIVASKITSLAHMLVGGTWTDNSPTGTAVAWAGWSVEYNGTTYAITNSDTTDKYIWWDLTSPTVFQKSATKPTLDTDDDFLACINEAGTHTQAWNATYIHGGTIQALSINTEEIAADAITATKIDVIGLDGATGQILVADETQANLVTAGINTHATTLITAGKIVISGATNLDDWQDGVDATKIDGGEIQTNTVTADAINANVITATHLVAGTITANEINSSGSGVDNSVMVDDSTQYFENANTAGAAALTTTAYESVQTDSITSGGGLIEIIGSCKVQRSAAGSGSATAQCELRDGSGNPIAESTARVYSYAADGDGIRVSCTAAEVPGSGSKTYTLWAKNSASPNFEVVDRDIMLWESRGK